MAKHLFTLTKSERENDVAKYGHHCLLWYYSHQATSYIKQKRDVALAVTFA